MNTFSKEEAKIFFETRATNLRSLSFEKENGSRSMENNTPEWDKAQTYVTDQSVSLLKCQFFHLVQLGFINVNME